MIPGFNTEVAYKGQRYHIQTEDLGRVNPSILTLLYRAGAIIYRVKTNYLEVLGPDPDEGWVKRLMEQQHRQVIADLKAGKFEERGGGKEGEKSLEQLILEYLNFRKGRGKRKP